MFVFAGLPAHNSHVQQPLNLSVLGPMQEYFKKLPSRKNMFSKKAQEMTRLLFVRFYVKCIMKLLQLLVLLLFS